MTVIDFQKAKERLRAPMEQPEFEWDDESILSFSDNIIIEFVELLEEVGLDVSANPETVKDLYVLNIAFVSAVNRLLGRENEFEDQIESVFIDSFGEVPIDQLNEIMTIEKKPVD